MDERTARGSKTKVVYNACYGGFSLSERAVDRYRELSGIRLIGREDDGRDIPRHDPHLVAVVEEMGEEANGQCAALKIEEIDGRMYRIDEYDGAECVETPDTIQWVTVEFKA